MCRVFTTRTRGVCLVIVGVCHVKCLVGYMLVTCRGMPCVEVLLGVC